MKKYTLPPEDRLALAPFHREFQAAVAVLANRTVGVDVSRPEGIGKWEGGVKVNGLEIAIKDDYVAEDWKRTGETRPEEIAVAEAIETLAANFKTHGGTTFEQYRDVAKTMYGDPLRSAILSFAR
jgi:hypothetical protein